MTQLPLHSAACAERACKSPKTEGPATCSWSRQLGVLQLDWELSGLARDQPTTLLNPRHSRSVPTAL